MPLILKHQTVEAFVARAREAYRNGSPDQLVKLSEFFLARTQAGDLTDAQVRAAFGLSTAQWASLKGRMQALVAARNTLNSAVGA